MTSRTVLSIAGLTLIVAFFLPWGLAGHVSGLTIATSGAGFFVQLAVILVPLAGLCFLGSSALDEKKLATAGACMLLGTAGYFGLQTARAFFALTNYGLWAVIIAGLIGVVAVIVWLMSKK